MNIITTSDDRRVEVIREVQEDFLKSLGEDKALEFLNRQVLVDVIIKHPNQPLYILGREIIEAEFNPLNDNEAPLYITNIEKKKRGRPKKCHIQ